MRTHIIWQLIKHDLRRQKTFLLCILLIPFLLEMLVIWQSDWILSNSGFTSNPTGFSDVVAAVLLVLPYLTVFVLQFSYTSHEATTGFYSLMHQLPVLSKELVTAKFIATICLVGGTGLWYVLLWWLYAQAFQLPSDSLVMGILFTMAFFFLLLIAIHYGLFFRNGANDYTGMIFVLLFIIFFSQQNFGKFALKKIYGAVSSFPVFTLTTAIIILLVVWLLCWRWAIDTYDKYLQTGWIAGKKPKRRNSND